jgi:hypothetical protein
MAAPVEGVLALRRRSVWEAADSGLLLWRRSFVYFFPFFAFPLWIFAFALRFLPESARPLSWLILWYFKPFFDRAVLHVVSVRFFEPFAGARRICRALGKSLFRSLPGDLLWRRFSPWRAVMIPVRVLEGLKFRRLRQRKKDLVKGGVDFCAVLSGWGLLLEWILLGGEILFFWSIGQISRPDLMPAFSTFLQQNELFFFAAWCVNIMLVESVYVCMGFGLYINSRVEVEGWDLEILFRRLAGNYRSVPGTSPAVFAVLFLVFVSLFPASSFAEDPVPPGLAAEEFSPSYLPLGSLEEILESRDFGGEKDGWDIGLKNRKTDPEENELSFPLAFKAENVKKFFAFSLVFVAAAAAVFFAVRLAHHAAVFRSTGRIKKEKYRGTFVPEEGESAASLFEKALAFRAMNSMREAWAACFGGTLAALSRRRGLVFPRGATEYDCLLLVRESGRDEAPFADLVKNWAGFAYGGRDPSAGAFERAMEFGGSVLASQDGGGGA